MMFCLFVFMCARAKVQQFVMEGTVDTCCYQLMAKCQEYTCDTCFDSCIQHALASPNVGHVFLFQLHSNVSGEIFNFQNSTCPILSWFVQFTWKRKFNNKAKAG